MEVMEKLAEIVCNVMESDGCIGHCNNPPCFEVERVVNALIDHGVTVQEQDGCEYCNGLPFSQMEDFTMPNASKKDYDIITIRYCPVCGRKLPQPPKGE